MFYSPSYEQTVKKRLGAGDGASFSLSGLASGKRYVVTLIAYRGAKRSKVVETSFKTGQRPGHTSRTTPSVHVTRLQDWNGPSPNWFHSTWP